MKRAIARVSGIVMFIAGVAFLLGTFITKGELPKVFGITDPLGICFAISIILILSGITLGIITHEIPDG